MSTSMALQSREAARPGLAKPTSLTVGGRRRDHG
jgi:hypothetical protein